MKIKTKILLFSSLIILLVLTILSLHFYVRFDDRKIETQKMFYTQLIKGVTELILISDDYMMYPYERKITQWHSTYDKLDKIIHKHKYSGAKFDMLYERLGTLKKLFIKLSSNHPQGQIPEELNDRIIGRIRLISHGILTKSESLAREKNQESEKIKKLFEIFFYAGALIIIFITLGFAVIIISSIATSLKGILAKSRNIAGGNYDYDFSLKSAKGNNDNEFQIISVSLDIMAKKLIDTIKQLGDEVTERKLTLQNLEESENKYRVLYKSASDAIFLIDVETMDLLDANEAALNLYGYTYDELQKLKATDLSNQAEETKQTLQHDSDTIIPIRYHKKKSGIVFPAEITANYFFMEGKSTNISAVRDISRRVESEKEKNRLEIKLRQSQKMESIGTLAGGIAHDFNNILSSIIGFSDLAIDCAEDGSELQGDLQEIKKAGGRAAELVRQILLFARQSDEKIKPVKLPSIAYETLKFLRASIPQNIEIVEKIDSKQIIMGNEAQVQQILMNLCTNASQSMERSGGVLSISIIDQVFTRESVPDNFNLNLGNYVKIEVSDTGVGIPPDSIDSIFDPYFSTKDVGEGTGLGLATVHGIVKRYSGDIKVESELGKGAVFTIYLPARNKALDIEKKTVAKLPRGNESLLIVDDEQAITKLIKKMLERLGYKVSVTNSSPEAVKIFRDDPKKFDLVITDMTMPEMTGEKLAIELMKLKPGIPIILCTGYSRVLSKEDALATGIRAYIEKPADKMVLSKTIRQVLDKT